MSDYDVSKIVPKRWHYCLREALDMKCSGETTCPDASCALLGGTQDGFVCLNCNRWATTVAAIRHRFTTCVPYTGPVRRGRT